MVLTGIFDLKQNEFTVVASDRCTLFGTLYNKEAGLCLLL